MSVFATPRRIAALEWRHASGWWRPYGLISCAGRSSTTRRARCDWNVFLRLPCCRAGGALRPIRSARIKWRETAKTGRPSINAQFGRKGSTLAPLANDGAAIPIRHLTTIPRREDPHGAARPPRADLNGSPALGGLERVLRSKRGCRSGGRRHPNAQQDRQRRRRGSTFRAQYGERSLLDTELRPVEGAQPHPRSEPDGHGRLSHDRSRQSAGRADAAQKVLRRRCGRGGKEPEPESSSTNRADYGPCEEAPLTHACSGPARGPVEADAFLRRARHPVRA